jgi:hypothetical protein
MLAIRLRTLEDAGIIERRRYSDRPPRFEYHFTRAGRDLVPVLITLQKWGDEHLPGDSRMPVRHTHAGHDHRLRAELICSTCGAPVVADDLSLGAVDPWGTPASA